MPVGYIQLGIAA